MNAVSYPLSNAAARLAIAPMMEWTDRHCRFMHRLLTRHAQLFSEMVVADAVLRGDQERLIGFSAAEHPLALQLGGSDPAKLAAAAAIGAAFGYDEINLNVGCPSNRVRAGRFGACLMVEPQLVGRSVAAIKEKVSVPVTVKCRIGVDDQDPAIALPALAHAVWAAGADRLWVHARKAWLHGLSPKDNRTVPPLNYALVHRLKAENPDRFIGINGGLETLEQALQQLALVDGVMLGRAAYRNPAMLRQVDRLVFGGESPHIGWQEFEHCMVDYCEAHLAAGGRLNQITRHMTGLFHGIAGARRFRQILATEAVGQGAGPEIVSKAFRAIDLPTTIAA